MGKMNYPSRNSKPTPVLTELGVMTAIICIRSVMGLKVMTRGDLMTFCS